MTVQIAIESATAAPKTAIPAPPSAASVMRSDRDIVGKLSGHLFIAAKILLEGKVSTAEKIKHEIRKILNSIERKIDEVTTNSDLNQPHLVMDYDRDPGEITLPSANSVNAWSEAVESLIARAQKIPVGCTSLSPEFKNSLAKLIKQGGKLAGGVSSVSEQARNQIDKAEKLYARLSGAYFL